MSLDAFKNLFSEKADANIAKVNKTVAKYNAKLAEFNEIWPIAMAEAESLGIGETFVKMFPEGGGFGGGDPLRGISPEYTNLLDYGDPFKPLVKKLYKLENSAERLKRTKRYLKQVTKYKDDGPEEYLLKIRQGIGGLIAGLSNPDSAWDNFIKFGDKFLEDPEGEDSPIESYSRRFKQAVDGPSGVLSSTALFAAVKEQGNPLSKISEESKDDELTTDALNPEEVTDDVDNEDGPINDGENEAVETEPENEVEVIAPEVEVELVPGVDAAPEPDVVIPAPISEQEDNFTEVTAPSPINAPATDASFDKDGDGNISMSEYQANVGDVVNNISENVTNEISSINTQNEAAQTKLDKTEGDYEASIGKVDTGEIQTESPEIEGESVASNTTINDESISFADIEAMKERFGRSDVSDGDTNIISKSSSVSNTINDSVSADDILNDNSSVSADDILNDNSITEGASTETNSINSTMEDDESISFADVEAMKERFGRSDTETKDSANIEVAKSKIGLDKNVAPINTPKSEEIKDDSSDSVTVDEILDEKPGSKSTDNTKSESSDNSTTSETNNNTNSQSGVDMSRVEVRLRKIENLLSGQLEVKIVD
jgi:hypothetical protein